MGGGEDGCLVGVRYFFGVLGLWDFNFDRVGRMFFVCYSFFKGGFEEFEYWKVFIGLWNVGFEC